MQYINFNLDIFKRQFTQHQVKQNDDLNLKIQILENGSIFDLQGHTVDLNVGKSDGTILVQSNKISIINNQIFIELDQEATKVPGEVNMEIKLLKDGKQKTTFDFQLYVRDSVLKTASEGTNKITILDDLNASIAEAKTIEEQMDSLLTNTNTQVDALVKKAEDKIKETDTLIQNAGAASKPELNAVKSQLDETKKKISVDVTEFQAKGDGISDDTLQIKTAIRFCKDNGIGQLTFKKGTYIIDFGFLIDFPLEIQGKDSVIKVKDNSTLFHNPNRSNDQSDFNFDTNVIFRDFHSVFTITTDRFKIENIAIDGNAYKQEDIVNGVVWNYVTPNTSDGSNNDGSRNYYKYFHGLCFYYKDGGAVNIDIKNVNIKNNTWNNICFNNRGLVVSGSFNIENSRFGNSPQDSISIHNLQSSLFSNIRNNSIINNSGHGVHLYYKDKNINVSNNNFKSDVVQNEYIKPNGSDTLLIQLLVSHGDYIDTNIDNINVLNNKFSTVSNLTSAVDINMNTTNYNISQNKFSGFINPIRIFNVSVSAINVIEKNIFNNSNNAITLRPLGAINSSNINIPSTIKNTSSDIIVDIKNNVINNGNIIDYGISQLVSINKSDINSYIVNVESYKNNYLSQNIDNNIFKLNANNCIPTYIYSNTINELKNIPMLCNDFAFLITDKNKNFTTNGRRADSIITETYYLLNESSFKNIRCCNITSTNPTVESGYFEAIRLSLQYGTKLSNGIYKLSFVLKYPNSNIEVSLKCQGSMVLNYTQINTNGIFNKHELVFSFDNLINYTDASYISNYLEFRDTNSRSISNLIIGDIKLERLI